MSIRQKAKITADANTTAQKIPLGAEDINSDWVTFLFQGDNAEDLELVGNENQDSGYPIEAGTRYISGPHRRDSDFPSIFLWAAQSDQVTVKVAESNEHNIFRHAPITDARDINDVTSDVGVSGEHNTSDPTLTDGDEDQIQLDTNARLITILEKAFSSVSEETIRNVEQEVNESFPVALEAPGVGPQTYKPNTPAASHAVESSSSRLIAVDGFIPDGEGDGNPAFLQIWNGDPTSGGVLETKRPIDPVPTQDGVDLLPSFSTYFGAEMGNGIWVVISDARSTHSPVSYGGIVHVRYV